MAQVFTIGRKYRRVGVQQLRILPELLPQHSSLEGRWISFCIADPKPGLRIDGTWWTGADRDKTAQQSNQEQGPKQAREDRCE